MIFGAAAGFGRTMACTGRTVWVASLLALSGCSLFGGGRPERGAEPVAARAVVPTPPPSSAVSWRDLATSADRERLRNWRASWTAAIAQIQRAGQADRLAAYGSLVQPDTVLDAPTPPVGDYRCRVIKLGSRASTGGLPMVPYPWFRCHIVARAGGLDLAKIDGSQRPVGRLYPHDATRMIFLGTMSLGDETRALDYGRDAERDMIGAFERIGARRWRLIFPAPRWESLIDVVELVPVG